MTTTQEDKTSLRYFDNAGKKDNGKCDGCNDFDNDEKHELTYVKWTHNDPTGEQGWAYDEGEQVKGYYCPDCLNSIRTLQRNRTTANTYKVIIFHELEVQAQSEKEASDIAFATRAKLNIRNLRVKITEE